MIINEDGSEEFIPLPLLLIIAAKLSNSDGGVGNLNNLLLLDIIKAIEIELEQREARIH